MSTEIVSREISRGTSSVFSLKQEGRGNLALLLSSYNLGNPSGLQFPPLQNRHCDGDHLTELL